MTAETRIAIADDSRIIRDLIEEIARYEPEYELVASFDNGRDIAAWVREGGSADVFVIDMRLPGLSGTATISALRRRQPDARILAFSASAQSESVKAALAAGADDYLLKESSLTELLDAISARGDHEAVKATASGPPVATASRVAGGDGATPASAGVEPGTIAEAPGDDAGESQPPPSAHAVSEPRGTGLKVLVLDDHDLVREATSALLEAHGFGVHTCETTAEVRDWLASGYRCDAALIDLRLGNESGAGMVAEIRVISPETAVILHSGAADQDGARVARETNADGFLAKGDYTIEEMVDTLSRAIELRRDGGD